MVIDTPKWDKITKRIVLGLIVSAVVAAIFLLLGIYIVGAASAEPLPLAEPCGPGGSCPHGYTSSGSFCVPSRGASDAIAKPPNGTGPWEWIASGSFCLRRSRRG